jgi:hypothetical protein
VLGEHQKPAEELAGNVQCSQLSPQAAANRDFGVIAKVASAGSGMAQVSIVARKFFRMRSSILNKSEKLRRA